MQLVLLMMSTGLLETYGEAKYIQWKSASSWLLTRITPRCTVNKIIKSNWTMFSKWTMSTAKFTRIKDRKYKPLFSRFNCG
jgi:hypothetical protein